MEETKEQIPFHEAFKRYIDNLSEADRLSQARLENEPREIYKMRLKLMEKAIKRQKQGFTAHLSKVYWQEGEPESKTDGDGKTVNLRHPLTRKGNTYRKPIN